MGSPEGQAKGVGRFLVTLLLAAFIMDSKPPKRLPSIHSTLMLHQDGAGDRLTPALGQSCQGWLIPLTLGDAEGYHAYKSEAPSPWA